MSHRVQISKIVLTGVLCMSAGLAHALYPSGQNPASPDGAKPAEKAAVSVSGAIPAAVKVTGGLLTDKNGMSLYTFDKDGAGSGKSNCHGDCAVSWPPLFAADTDKQTGDFTVAVRNDGRRQWAYKGRPLYLWVGDTKAGQTTGDGVGGVWRLAR
jgi:predicted lipoprotein with Yx(FWY)xxD motif